MVEILMRCTVVLALLVVVYRGAAGSDGCDCMQDEVEVLSVAGISEFSQHPDHQHLSEEERKLLQEYWEAWPQLQAFYGNLQMTGIVHPIKPETSTDIRLSYYSRDNELFRLDSAPVNTSVQASGGVAVITPDEQYLLGTDRETGQHFLKGHANRLAEARWRFCQYSYHDAPFSSIDGPLAPSLLLNLPNPPHYENPAIESVTLDRDAEDGALVVIRYRKAPGALMTAEFYRDRSWALKSMTEEWVSPPQEDAPAGAASRNTVNCSYSEDVGGFPLLESVYWDQYFTETDDVSKLALTRAETFAVEKIEARPAARETFDVYRLLEQDLESVSNRQSDLRWWLLIVNGVVLALAGWYFLRKQRNHSGQTYNL